jgi:hypothetical protein
MGIAAFVCLTVSYAVSKGTSLKNYLKLGIGVAEFAEAGHCSNRPL